jgi:hypothetical protein
MTAQKLADAIESMAELTRSKTLAAELRGSRPAFDRSIKVEGPSELKLRPQASVLTRVEREGSIRSKAK